MKKLLTLFSDFVLGSGSVFGVASCRTRPKHIIDDEEVNANKDLEILNQIKEEVNQTLIAWWDTKATIDINDYPDQRPFLTELVDELKKENDGLTLTSETISKYRFLTILLSGFNTEFNNLNQNLRERYSNYYVDTMPLRLAEDDISFTLYNINFDNIAKLLEGTSEMVLGITVHINIHYEIMFKELLARDNIESPTVISNDLDSLNKIQDNIAKYFVNFLNNIFKSKNFEMIIPVNHDANSINASGKEVKQFVAKCLSGENILFKNNDRFHIRHYNQYRMRRFSEKRNASVLAGAGEGYDPEKLTPENFLKFYRVNFSPEGKESGKYYVIGFMTAFIPDKFTIENLPFKNPEEEIILKQEVRLLKEKDKVEDELAEFAKMTMDFGNYFKLETWNDNNRLVFKMNQADFDKLVEKNSKNYKHSITTDKMENLLGYIIEFF